MAENSRIPPARPQDEKRALLPIGIFDSGVGGLTVLAALRASLPREQYLYLGDTARLPYGTKSAATVARYSLQATEKLVERRIKLLVVACNTATAAALPELQKAYAPLPVVGVVEPGARAACKAVENASGNGGILVLGTESTIRGKAYTKAIQAIRPDARVTGIACSLFVALAEEGWMGGPIVESVARRYLEPVLKSSPGQALPDCIVLGCTHFPPLAPAIAAVAGKNVAMVDSAATTAAAVKEELRRHALLRPEQDPPQKEMQPPWQSPHFLTTDAPERFARVGGHFLGEEIRLPDLELVTL